MRQLLWLSLIPLTAFWLFSLDIYGPAPNGPAPVFVMAAASILSGVALSIAGLWSAEATIDRRYALVLVPLALSSLIIPYPYNAGLIISASALLAALIAPGLSQVWLGALLAGSILALHSLTLSIYYLFAPDFHQVGWLGALLAVLSGLTGLDSGSNQGILLISSQESIFPFTVTLEKLGFYPWILIFTGYAAITYLTSRKASDCFKVISGAFMLSLAYILLRYLILVHIFFSWDLPEWAGERMKIFTDPWWLLASFTPLVLLYLWRHPLSDVRLDLKFQIQADRKVAFALAAVLLSGFCLTSSAVFQDPGVEKGGRVLVDEIHSLWESSTLRLDKDWYGEGSTYNAYSMIEWLGDTYEVDRVVSSSYWKMNASGASKVVPEVVSERLTPDLLRDYDILIIKTPSKYDTDEVAAIVSFVEDGGGLFLIGDHTNFGGTGTNLNQISKRFGIEFGFDSVNTLNGTLYYHERGPLPHPVERYMPSLDFMTGCSLKAPVSGEPAILGFGLNAEPGEYSSVGFFRETRINDPTHVGDTTFGLINQAVALKYGRGRVVAFADSTIISNFRIFFGGSPNMVIGSMEYLNRENSYECGRLILLLAGLAALAMALFMLAGSSLGRRKMAALVIAISLGALSASGALLVFSTEAEDTIPGKFYVRDRTVGFDGEHSCLITSQGDRTGPYETFFIWTQRVNLTPAIESSMEEAMAKGRFLVVIDPKKPLSVEEAALLLDYVREGNSLLLMVSSAGPWSGIPGQFGMETYHIDEPHNATWSEKGGLPIKPWGLAIRGGRELLSIDGRVVLAGSDYGRGRFLLFTDSHVFKNGLFGQPGYMGFSKIDPATLDEEAYDLRALYDLEYRIFEDYLRPEVALPAPA